MSFVFKKTKSLASNINTGQQGEKIAQVFLQNKGFVIIDKNFTHGRLEIDIVAREKLFLIIKQFLINLFKLIRRKPAKFCDELSYLWQEFHVQLTKVYFFEVKTSQIDSIELEKYTMNPQDADKIIGPELRINAQKLKNLEKAINYYTSVFHVKHWAFYGLIVLYNSSTQQAIVKQWGSGTIDL